MNLQKVVIPTKLVLDSDRGAGIHKIGNYMKILDSRLYWNDPKVLFGTFCEAIKLADLANHRERGIVLPGFDLGDERQGKDRGYAPAGS
ncbi:MAG: hypothetical protein HY739_15635 [Desulfobacterales bacterium]|nr:hypothetical protein [Desulfobacterales bacterium]